MRLRGRRLERVGRERMGWGKLENVESVIGLSGDDLG